MAGEEEDSLAMAGPNHQKPSRSRSNASSSSASARAKRPRHEDATGLSVSSQNEFTHSTVQGQARAHFGNNYYINAHDQRQHPVMHANNAATSEGLDQVMLSLKYERMSARYFGLKTGLAQTCKWLYDTEEYTSWRNRSEMDAHHGCLWIKGKPGSGKTTLMKTVVDADKKRLGTDAVISHFFHRGSNEVSADNMCRSLIHQLLEQIPRLQSVLEIWKAANLQKGEWPPDLLKSIFRAAVLRLENDTLTCYVDALDECDDNEASGIVEYFEDLVDSTVSEGIRFSLCFSSRHYPHITMVKCQDLILDHQDGHFKDIEKFVKGRLQLKNSARKRTLAREICRKASGVFLWVYLVVGLLNKDNRNGDATNLQNRLETMPTELPKLFEEIVRKNGRDEPEFIRAIQWTLFSHRPLRCEELYCAVQSFPGCTERLIDYEEVDTDDMGKYILKSSKGFVELVKSKPATFQFIHETVREYFFSVGLAALNPTLENNLEGHSHEELKKCCYDYIFQGSLARFHIPKSLPQARSPEAEQLRSGILRGFPLLEYALSGLLYHADMAHCHKVTQHDFIKEFPISLWKKLNNCLEKYQSRRYTEYLGRRWIFAERDASFLLELDLQQNPHVETRSRPGTSLLGVAVDHNNLRSVELLLHHGEHPFSFGKKKGLCLDLAVNNGAAKIVTMLLASGACAEDETVDLALRKGDLETTKAVIMSKIERSTCGEAYGDFLLGASSHQNLEALQWLLEQGAAVDTQRGDKGTALQEACAKGHVEVVLALLEHSADVNIQSGPSGNALQAASEGGHASVVKILLDWGAKIDARGHGYYTALLAASIRGCTEVVSTLLEAGAGLNTPGGHYGSELQAVAQQDNPSAIFRLLMASGADVNLEGGYYGNALQAVCAVKCTKCTRPPAYGIVSPCRAQAVRLLLDNGSDINAHGGYYGSALQAACAHSCPRVARLLLDKGADPIAEGGFYGSITAAVEMNDRTDIAGMVIDATVKRWEILKRFRREFSRANVASPIVVEDSDGEDETELSKPELEEPTSIRDETQAQTASMETLRISPTETSPRLASQSITKQTEINAPVAAPAHDLVTAHGGDCAQEEHAATIKSHFRFEGGMPEPVAAPMDRPRVSSERMSQPGHSKAMKRAMVSLFGFEHTNSLDDQPKPPVLHSMESDKVSQIWHDKGMRRTMISLFGLKDGGPIKEEAMPNAVIARPKMR